MWYFRVTFYFEDGDYISVDAEAMSERDAISSAKSELTPWQLEDVWYVRCNMLLL